MEEQNKAIKNWAALPDIFGVKELAAFLNVGTATAYQLTKQSGFPSFKVGRTIKISKESLQRWITQRAESRGHLYDN